MTKATNRAMMKNTAMREGISVSSFNAHTAHDRHPLNRGGGHEANNTLRPHGMCAAADPRPFNHCDKHMQAVAQCFH
jgi:hypothetical protein